MGQGLGHLFPEGHGKITVCNLENHDILYNSKINDHCVMFAMLKYRRALTIIHHLLFFVWIDIPFSASLPFACSSSSPPSSTSSSSTT